MLGRRLVCLVLLLQVKQESYASKDDFNRFNTAVHITDNTNKARLTCSNVKISQIKIRSPIQKIYTYYIHLAIMYGTADLYLASELTRLKFNSVYLNLTLKRLAGPFARLPPFIHIKKYSARIFYLAIDIIPDLRQVNQVRISH